MNTSARQEKRIAFNEQMNAWISRQGLWFQLRHAPDGQSIMSRLWRLSMRFGVILIIAIVIGWYALSKRVEWKSFHSQVEQTLTNELGAEKCELGTIRKERNQLLVTSIKAEGSEKSFFHNFEVRMARMKMGVTDGMMGSSWDAGTVSVDSAICRIRAGSGDDATAKSAYQSLFPDMDGFNFDILRVESIRVSWGYSESSNGEIRDSQMIASRTNDQWRLEFTGGYFTQNWLRDLPIKQMVVVCDSKGVHIESAELLVGEGSILFSGDFGSGGQPAINGTVEIKSVPLKYLLESHYHDWLSGRISGKGTISGSTNSLEGIAMDIDVSLKDGDELILRDNYPVLSALTVVDLYNSYRKVALRTGSFKMKTGSDLLTIEEMNLKSGDLFHLKGDIHIRPPSNAEVATTLNLEGEEIVAHILDQNRLLEAAVTNLGKDKKFTLKDAASQKKEKKAGKREQETEEKKFIKMWSKTVVAEKKTVRFGGTMRIGLKSDALDKSPRLKEKYPVDAESERIWIDAPLSGHLQALTLDIAKILYTLGRNMD